jgi:uncharacterized membrane protein YdbT with pleckstrin-like domain
MAYVDELLGRGEQIIYVARQHVAVLMSRMITGLVLIALLIAAGVVSNTAFSHNSSPLIARLTASDLILIGTFIISVIVLLNILGNFLRWNAEQYVLTDRRVIQITGVLSKTVIDASLSKINDVAFTQNLLGRMFDFGSIEILTGADDTSNVMEGVAEPLNFKRAMLEAKYNYDRGYGYLEPQTRTAQSEQQPVLAQFDVHRTLEELARLRDRGILSRDEFEAKKRELLNRI